MNKYTMVFFWIAFFSVAVIFYNIITSPDAYTAGQRSTGVGMFLFGAFLVWFIVWMFKCGKPVGGDKE